MDQFRRGMGLLWQGSAKATARAVIGTMSLGMTLAVVVAAVMAIGGGS